MLPAMVANMMPVIGRYMRFLDVFDKPIDGSRTLRGKPLFGRNKTYRGFIVGISGALVVGVGQYALAQSSEAVRSIEMVDNLTISTYMVLALLLSIGALVGDATESMIKRQLEIKPGGTWFPYDQLDYVFGALIVAAPLAQLEGIEVMMAIFVGFFLHPVTTLIGYRLGIREKPI